MIFVHSPILVAVWTAMTKGTSPVSRSGRRRHESGLQIRAVLQFGLWCFFKKKWEDTWHVYQREIDRTSKIKPKSCDFPAKMLENSGPQMFGSDAFNLVWVPNLWFPILLGICDLFYFLSTQLKTLLWRIYRILY
jgi:hypothetical protein